MGDLEHIDEVLGSAIDGGDVPGVVAMATTRDGVAYAAKLKGGRVSRWYPARSICFRRNANRPCKGLLTAEGFQR